MSTLRTTWTYGEKSELARRVGIPPAYLGSILHGRQRATPERAAQIEDHALTMGLHLTRLDVMYPTESANPLITCHNPTNQESTTDA